MARDPTNQDVAPNGSALEVLNTSDDRQLRVDGKRLCTATSRSTGLRCQSPPIVGGFVCGKHGGGLPYVKAAARRRLMALVDPAIEALHLAIQSANPCESCGLIADSRHAAVVVRAAQLVLDRTGHGPSAKSDEDESKAPDWAKFLSDEQLETVMRWVSEAKEKAGYKERGTVTVLDGDGNVVVPIADDESEG